MVVSEVSYTPAGWLLFNKYSDLLVWVSHETIAETENVCNIYRYWRPNEPNCWKRHIVQLVRSSTNDAFFTLLKINWHHSIERVSYLIEERISCLNWFICLPTACSKRSFFYIQCVLCYCVSYFSTLVDIKKILQVYLKSKLTDFNFFHF